MASALDDHYAYCETLLRERDRDVWLACLFAPRPARRYIHAIYACALDIADAPRKVTQPLLGEMRLRWWTDALMADDASQPRAHPIADALIDAIERFGLPRDEVVALAEAHILDLYDDPIPTLAALEDYCRLTASAPMRWAAKILGAPDSPAFNDAGVALGLTNILRSPRARRFLPAELIERHGGADAGLRAAAMELREAAARRYRRARAAAVQLVAGREALLPAVIVPLYLEALERRSDPFGAGVDPSPLRRQWRLWRAARGAGL
jgi:phytoene synthase